MDDKLVQKLRTVSKYLSREELKFIQRIVFNKHRYKMEMSDNQVDYLEILCLRGEDRKEAGFEISRYGTHVNRLVNNGLHGASRKDYVSMADIARFKELYYDKEIGEINPDLVRRVLEGGRRVGKLNKIQEEKQREIELQYLKSFRLFEEYLDNHL